ncbi:DUF5959 family protein [Streptomyces sp. NPDC013455]|uniref:DUF5959 family protein n=1 Tax=Streptomyces sp. NPDC013455 TaxID=3155605 RepID=UPI0033DFE7C1
MAGEPIDLIRLEGGRNSVVLRIDGKQRHERTDVLVGEFEVRTPFVRGSLQTWVFPDDLRQWQQALDLLDAGRDAAWREGGRAPWLFIERDEDDDRCRVTLQDHSMSLTAVTVTVPLTDAWFDDAYDRLDRIWETWPPSGDQA